MIFASEPIGLLFSFSFQRSLGPLRAACWPDFYSESAIWFLARRFLDQSGLSKFERGVSRDIRSVIKRAGISESKESFPPDRRMKTSYTVNRNFFILV